MKLYEIPAEIRLIEDMIAEAEGVITPETEARLEQLELEFRKKAEYLALLIREAQTEVEAYKIEETRLKERRQAAENRADRMKAYLHAQMTAMGETKIHGKLATVSVVGNSRPSVSWTGDWPPPAPYQRIKVELDTQAVLDHMKISGGKPPVGAKIEVGTHLRIR